MSECIVHTAPRECFEHAIFEGVLSEDETANNFAHNFMYMYTVDGRDVFKHIETRQTVRSTSIRPRH